MEDESNTQIKWYQSSRIGCALWIIILVGSVVLVAIWIVLFFLNFWRMSD